MHRLRTPTGDRTQIRDCSFKGQLTVTATIINPNPNPKPNPNTKPSPKPNMDPNLEANPDLTVVWTRDCSW